MSGSLFNVTSKINSRTEAQVQLSILGQFALRINGSPLSEPDNYASKRRSIISYLILHRERAVSQTELIEIFYEDENQINPVAALKMQIGRIRKWIGTLMDNETEVIKFQFLFHCSNNKTKIGYPDPTQNRLSITRSSAKIHHCLIILTKSQQIRVYFFLIAQNRSFFLPSNLYDVVSFSTCCSIGLSRIWRIAVYPECSNSSSCFIAVITKLR